jgi:hypothetical protein
MAIMAALAVRYFHRPRLITLVWVGMSFIMIMNVKLTGIVYAGAFGAGFVVFEIASRGFRLAQKWAIALALSVVCGIVLGFSPYITNYLQNHDIVRPLREAREQKNHDPYKLQRPENMTKLSRLERLAASIFSRSNASGPPLRYEYKIPFLVSRDELESIKVLDCRVGGFGPWFGGALILSLLVLGWRLYLRDAQAHWLMLPMGLVLATVLLNPESWWARFVPQTWILPLIPLWVTGTFKGPIALRRLRQGALFVFAVNAVGVAALSLGYQVENARQVEYSMDRLLLLPGPLGVDFGPWDAAKHRFEARGIPFVDLTHSKSRRCQPMVRVGSAELKICPNGIY